MGDQNRLISQFQNQEGNFEGVDNTKTNYFRKFYNPEVFETKSRTTNKFSFKIIAITLSR